MMCLWMIRTRVYEHLFAARWLGRTLNQSPPVNAGDFHTRPDTMVIMITGDTMNYIIQHKKQAIYITAGLLMASFLWFLFWPPSVPAYAVVEQDYVPSLLLSGEVISERTTLISARNSGLVIACPVDKGEKIRQGQLLVQIDDTHPLLNRDRATAAVEMARSQLEKAATVNLKEARASSVQADLARDKAELEYERIKALNEAGAVSQAALEEAERNKTIGQEKARAARALMESLEQGGANIAVLQAELKQRQLDLAEKEMLVEQCKVLAPADGELLDLYATPGELVAEGGQVALVTYGEGLRIQIQPDQRYAGLAAIGNRAEVWINNSADTKWDAQVVATEPVANAEQGSFMAELEFTGVIPPLYPGQLLSVQLFGPVQPEAVIIPETYLTVEGGVNGVWLATGNRAHFTVVQLGTRTTDGVVITQGLEKGNLIMEPLGFKEGQRLSLRQEKR